MISQDRKLAWSGIVVAATIAAEFAWYLFVGPTPSAVSCTGEGCHEVFWTKPEFWTAATTFALAVTTLGLWLQTKRLAEGADDQSAKMVKMIAATQASAKAAAASAETAEKARITSDRPWIEIKAENVGPLVFDEENVTAEIDIAISNVGKSPASFVILYAKLHSDSFSAQMYTQKTAREHFSSALLGYGNILFPNASRKRTYELKMPKADFIAKIVETNKSIQASDDKEVDKTPYTHAWLAVSAMAFYVLPNDPYKRPKYTTLILDLMLKRPDILGDGEPFEVGFDGSNGTFSPDTLLVEQSYLSGESS